MEVPYYEDKLHKEKALGAFLRLCLVRCFKKEKILGACENFISQTLNNSQYYKFITEEDDRVDIELILKASSAIIPV